MAKITSAFLVLALIAMPFLNGIEAAGRSLPPAGANDDHSNKLYGAAQFWWGLWPFGLFHPWLFGPFWWLKNAKTTTTNTTKASNYVHETPKVPEVGSTLGYYASTHSP